jgi:hypothetical protein
LSLKHYYEALERLKNGKPEILDEGYDINNDTVALEANRGRGSIKAKRHPELISAINDAADIKRGLDGNTETDSSIEMKYQAALNREVLLVERLRELELKIIELEKSMVQQCH